MSWKSNYFNENVRAIAEQHHQSLHRKMTQKLSDKFDGDVSVMLSGYSPNSSVDSGTPQSSSVYTISTDSSVDGNSQRGFIGRTPWYKTQMFHLLGMLEFI